MLRSLLMVGFLTLATLTAQAHFVFVVPDAADPTKALVVFSDDLAPDENVSIDKISGLKLTCRQADGKESTIACKPGKHALMVEAPGSGPRLLYGSLPYAVMQKGEGKPFLLSYHPKAVIGPVSTSKLDLGVKTLPVELLPIVTGTELRFKLVAEGKPVSNAEVTVIKAMDGNKTKVTTDQDGLTPPFPAKDRYGAWSKHTIAKPGEHDGKKYDEARHYATLVVDLPK